MMRLLFLLGALVAMLFAASLAIGPAEASFAKSLSSLLDYLLLLKKPDFFLSV